MAPFEALYGRICRYLSGWFDVAESAILRPGIVHESVEKVRKTRDRLATTYSCQKSYADNRKKDREFEVGDQVYLKISPMKEAMSFGKKRKLSPRYLGPNEILHRVGKVSYELKITTRLCFCSSSVSGFNAYEVFSRSSIHASC